MASHVSKVRSLYKRILLLHHFMPIDLRALGDQYVKDEFRKHKTASNEEAKRFMTEWELVAMHSGIGFSVNDDLDFDKEKLFGQAIPDKLEKGLPIYVISIGNDSAYIQKLGMIFGRMLVTKQFLDPIDSQVKVYKDTLQTQILESVNRKKLVFGADLSEEKLKGFQDEQIGQLYELMLESTKPNRQFDIQEEDMPK